MNVYIPNVPLFIAMGYQQYFEDCLKRKDSMLQEILKRMIVHMENLEWSEMCSGATALRLATPVRFPSCPDCHGVKPTQVYAPTYFPANRIGHKDGCQVAKDLDDMRQLVLPVAAVEAGKGTLNQLLKEKAHSCATIGHTWIKNGSRLECPRCDASRIIAEIP